MKKITKYVLVLNLIITISIDAKAIEISKEKNPGITPDSFLYFFDNLTEKFELIITFDEYKKTELLIEHARERLAEAKAMEAQGKTNYVEETIKIYAANLEVISDKIIEINILNNQNEDGIVLDTKQLEDKLDNIIIESNDILQVVPEKVNNEVQNIKINSYIKVSGINNMDKEVVTKIKNEDELEYDIIVKLNILSESIDVSIEDLIVEYKEIEDIDALINKYEMSKSNIVESAMTLKGDELENRLEEAVNNEDVELTNILQERIIQNEKEVTKTIYNNDIKDESNQILADLGAESVQELDTEQTKDYLQKVRESKDNYNKEIKDEIEEITKVFEEVIKDDKNIDTKLEKIKELRDKIKETRESKREEKDNKKDNKNKEDENDLDIINEDDLEDNSIDGKQDESKSKEDDNSNSSSENDSNKEVESSEEQNDENDSKDDLKDKEEESKDASEDTVTESEDNEAVNNEDTKQEDKKLEKEEQNIKNDQIDDQVEQENKTEIDDLSNKDNTESNEKKYSKDEYDKKREEIREDFKNRLELLKKYLNQKKKKYR